MEKLDLNPWWSVWFSPRKTVRSIVEFDPSHGLKRLSFLYGLAMMFGLMRTMGFGNVYSMPSIIIASVILALPLGYIVIHISTALFFWVSKWFKGAGSFEQVRSAVAWANVPAIVNILAWILLMVFAGHSSFSKMPLANPVLIQFVFWIQVIASFWGFIIFLQALGEVSGFSAWMSLLAAIIVSILWMIILSAFMFGIYSIFQSTPGVT